MIGHFSVEVVHIHVSVDDRIEANGLVGSEVGGPIILSIDVREAGRLRNVFRKISAAAAVLGALVDVAKGELLLWWRFHSG